MKFEKIKDTLINLDNVTCIKKIDIVGPVINICFVHGISQSFRFATKEERDAGFAQLFYIVKELPIEFKNDVLDNMADFYKRDGQKWVKLYFVKTII